MMSDAYIDKEDNSRVKDVILSFLTSDEVSLNKIDAEDPEVSDYTLIPDTSRLSELPRVCLQESEEIPPDYTRYQRNVQREFMTKMYNMKAV